MQSITPLQLKEKISNKEDFLLIDVREVYEHNDFNIGGLLIPLNSLFENISMIPNERPVVMYCQKGIRSQLAIQRLQQKFNFSNLVNLSGGVDAWRRDLGYSRI